MNEYDDAVIVALGSNQPWQGLAPREVLEAALARFPAAGLKVVKRSSWWRSKAWPDPSDPEFLNGVAIVETQLTPQAVMAALLDLERQFGRERTRPNAPRTLDLDLIAYGREQLGEPGLTLPHPKADERRFVMGPLAEIAPRWRHPVLAEPAEVLARGSSVGADAEPSPALHNFDENPM